VSSELTGPVPNADGLSATQHLVAHLQPMNDAAAATVRYGLCHLYDPATPNAAAVSPEWRAFSQVGTVIEATADENGDLAYVRTVSRLSKL
jgi:hypothetical protein